MDLRDDFELRNRHPEIHQLSYDSEVLFMLIKPENDVPENVFDSGAFLVDRTNQEDFRKKFLFYYPENEFQKMPISSFFALKRPIVYDEHGNLVRDDWHLDTGREIPIINHDHIFVVMPRQWAEDSEAVKRFNARMDRVKKRSLPTPQNSDSRKVRNPNLKFISQNFPNSSKNIDLQEISDTVEDFEQVNNISDFGTPQSQGNMSLKK